LDADERRFLGLKDKNTKDLFATEITEGTEIFGFKKQKKKVDT
jgi:hypothetical protein